MQTVVRRALQAWRKKNKFLNKERKNSNRDQSVLWGKLFFMIAAGAASDVALLCNEVKTGYRAQSQRALAYECHLSSIHCLAILTGIGRR